MAPRLQGAGSKREQVEVNPAPSLLLQQASMLKASLGVKAAATRRGERRWMQRWRARRGLQLRKFPAQERLPVDLMQRKVRHREGGYVRRFVVVLQPPYQISLACWLRYVVGDLL